MSDRLLVVTTDRVGAAMAGPAIRALEMARHLRIGLRADVTLAAPRQPEIEARDGVDLIGYEQNPRTFARLAQLSSAIVVQGTTLEVFPWLKRVGGRLIVDLYDPFHLENLELYRFRQSGLAQDRLSWDLRVLTRQLRAGDFFLCASDRQRDYWLGMLTAAGRLRAADYQADPTLRRLIDVVPYGLPDRPPEHTKPVLKGVYRGIAPSDRVILWGGGIWDWLDPFTTIRAIGRLHERSPDIRLFFMGTRRPGDAHAGQRQVHAARALASELGLLDRAVFFNDWVGYAERDNYLVESDLGITIARGHLENHYAFRARILDYLWAGLPIVCSAGDILAERVGRDELGEVVADGDVEACAEACRRLLFDHGARERARRGRDRAVRELRWTAAIQPLISYLEAGPSGRLGRIPSESRWRSLADPLLLARLGWLSLRSDGVRAVIGATWRLAARQRLLRLGGERGS